MKCVKCKQEVTNIIKDNGYCYICHAEALRQVSCEVNNLYQIGTKYCFNGFYQGVLVGVTENEVIIEYPATFEDVEKRKAGRVVNYEQMIIERRHIKTVRIIKWKTKQR